MKISDLAGTQNQSGRRMKKTKRREHPENLPRYTETYLKNPRKPRVVISRAEKRPI